MKFVFDANVLISAALFRESVPGLAYKNARQKGKILISDKTLNELKITLNKPKFRKYITLKDKFGFLTKLEGEGVLIEISQFASICRDPKDNMYLDLALSGKADAIITGDADLLTLHPFCDIPIVTPKYFLNDFKFTVI